MLSMVTRIRTAELGKLIFRTILSLIIIVVLVYLGKQYVGKYLQVGAKLFIEKFGLLGLFIDVYLVDALIVPLTPDVFLLILVSNETNQIFGLILICIASVLGGISGYGIGKYLHKLRIVQRLTSKYEQRGEKLFQRYGTWAVAIAAFTPIPFSTICWLAGIFKMDFKPFVLATFFRIPRMVIYYLMILLGWLY